MALPMTKRNDPKASTNPTRLINEARLRGRQVEARPKPIVEMTAPASVVATSARRVCSACSL
jgi:hypothetical protein